MKITEKLEDIDKWNSEYKEEHDRSNLDKK
jgi:hypothetical protein